MEREERLEKVISDLVQKVRLYHKKYGNEYLGGTPFHCITQEIEKLGIDVEEEKWVTL